MIKESFDYLDRLKIKYPLFKDIATFISNEIISPNKGLSIECYIEKDTNAFVLSSPTKITIQFVFWLGEQTRFSFFIENREVLDEYITSINESHSILVFLKTLLSNKISKKIWSKNQKITKIIYEYTIPNNEGDNEIFTDKAMMSMRILPLRSDQKTILFDSWISVNLTHD